MNELLDISRPGKRHTLLLSLLRQARMRCRDELTEMMLRRIRRTQAAAKEHLEALHDQHREIEEALIGIFGRVLETAQAQETDIAFGHQVRQMLAEQGGFETLAEQCETVSAWHHKNDLPLLWPIHAKHRSLLFQLIDLLDIRSATQDVSLLDALSLVRRLRRARRDEVLDAVDLGFVAERWQRFVVKARSEPAALDRRALEVCAFVHLADALQAGDLYVVGSEISPTTAPSCCRGRNASRGWPPLRRPRHARKWRGFRCDAEARTDRGTAAVDAGFADNPELSIDPDGTPHLKQLATAERPEGLAEFEQEVRARMPERHLLDVLKNAEHWARFTRHFAPPSGSDPKLAQAVQRYLFIVFGYGCNLGPNQTARHAPEIATAQALRRINAQHINAGKLEAAMVDVIGQYVRFSCLGIGAAAAPRSPTART